MGINTFTQNCDTYTVGLYNWTLCYISAEVIDCIRRSAAERPGTCWRRDGYVSSLSFLCPHTIFIPSIHSLFFALLPSIFRASPLSPLPALPRLLQEIRQGAPRHGKSRTMTELWTMQGRACLWKSCCFILFVAAETLCCSMLCKLMKLQIWTRSAFSELNYSRGGAALVISVDKLFSNRKCSLDEIKRR